MSDPLTISAGLMFVPFCRNCIQNAETLLSLDYSAFSFLATPATQSSVGRDVGFQAKGHFSGNRIEYRVGAFQGFRATGARNPLRAAGRLQVNLLDAETPGISAAGHISARSACLPSVAVSTRRLDPAAIIERGQSTPFSTIR